jgi:hypothetical protein
MTSVSISKIDESYNTDKAPDTLTSKEDLVDYRTEHENHENKGNLQDIPSENSSMHTSSKVNYIFYIIYIISIILFRITIQIKILIIKPI